MIKYFVFVFVFLIISCNAQKSEKMKVIYVYDALCGWCYGFSPVMQKFADKYKDDIEIETLSGGMITGNRIGPIGEVAPYISWAYKEVENTCNVKFGTGFLNGILADGKTIFTSLPPSIALSVFKTYQIDESVAFASRLQKAIYFDGIVPLVYDSYGKLAAEFGIDATEFVKKMSDQKYLKSTQEEFEKCQKLGVTGFPTVFVLKNDKYYPIAKGYTTFENLESEFVKLKN